MIIEGKSYSVPPEGQYNATCIDVVDLGVVPGFQGKPTAKLRVHWILDEVDDLGQHYTITKPYTKSINEKSNFSKDLQLWRGRAFTADERARFDTETLIGKSCQLYITHRITEKDTYANVQTILPMKKGEKGPSIPPTYVRKQDRPDYVAPGSVVEASESTEPDTQQDLGDDDVPF